jgi:hypothetical protein
VDTGGTIYVCCLSIRSLDVTPDKKITLNKTLVITVAKTMKEMADQYIQGTTGLQIDG